VDLGANLKRNVLSDGLDPIGDEQVDDVPWVIGPFGYTVCMYVCLCACAHVNACLARSLRIMLRQAMGARFKFPFIEMSLDGAPSFFYLLKWFVNRSLFIGTHFLIRYPSVPYSWASVLIIVTHFHIRYSIVLFSTSGGRRSSG
jgi:hypothetical protein